MRKRKSRFEESARRIRAVRTALGWSQQKFSEELRVSPAAVSAFETGEYEPPGEVYVRIANLASQAEWFWRKAGEDLQDALRAAGEILKERGRPAAPGEIVRVPPMIKIAQEGEDLPFPASMIPSPLATRYLRIGDVLARPTWEFGDTVLIDESTKNWFELIDSPVAVFGERSVDQQKLAASSDLHLDEEQRKQSVAYGVQLGWLVMHGGTLVLKAPGRTPLTVATFEHGATEPRVDQNLTLLGRVVGWLSGREPRRKRERKPK